MGRPIHKLSGKQLDAWVKQAKDGTLTKRFMKSDGNGLWFHVAPPNGASWLFRYAIGGKERLIAPFDPSPELIGNKQNAAYPALSLKKARERAEKLQALLADGIDPLAHREAEAGRRRAETAKVRTFKECAQDYIRANAHRWKNPVHAAQWPSTLEAYVYPFFGDLPVAEVDVDHVLAALRQDVKDSDGKVIGPLWETKGETARRLQQRIKLVLDAARAAKLRGGDNPADWAGTLKPLLGQSKKDQENHPRLEHDRMGEFMVELRSRQAISALALEFTILTAARTGEVIGATWGEIDLDAKLWTVPAKRMKASKEHRVPLSEAAVAVLRKMLLPGQEPDAAAYVFPGQSRGKPLSNMAMLTLLQKRMMVRNGKGELVTVHGFRGTFSTWAGDHTSYPRDLIEVALAHPPKDKSERAYNHAEMIERRSELMEAWADLCAGPSVDSKVKKLADAKAEAA